MSDKDLIQWPKAKWWTRDWNPIIGCHLISPACENCWARAWAERFKQPFEPHRSSKTKPPKKGIVFCGGLTDLFGDWVSSDNDFIGRTLGNHNAAYIWLTKRPANMVRAIKAGTVFIKSGDTDGVFPFSKENLENHFFGFTAENQEWYNKRVWDVYNAHLTRPQFWISVEPLLGPISLNFKDEAISSLFSCVIVGCESGPNRRECKIEWIESIVDQCRSAGVPVFVKQIMLNGRCETDISKFPEHLRIRQLPWAKYGEGEVK